MTLLKSIVKDWLPPAVVRGIQSFGAGGIRYNGNFSSWAEAASFCTGYDAENILDKVLNATLRVKRGEAAYEQDSVLFDKVEYAWPITAGLMWAAARTGGELNVLDFGGALGSTYFQNRVFLSALPSVRWNIVEQEHYVHAGKKYVQDQNLRFYSSIDACLSENRINVIVFSSVLQYLELPYDLIEKFKGAGVNFMIIDKTPFFTGEDSKLLIQTVPPSIYNATYPMRVFSRDRFGRALSDNWNVVAEYENREGSVKFDSKLTFSFQGMLLEARR